MKAPKFATMSLDALYSMRNTLEKAISSQLKTARKGIASLTATKPKRKTKKKASKARGATGRKTTARKTTARKATRMAKPMRRAAAKRKTMTRVSRKRK
ncbi:hypothetical protein GJW-30_1_01405 [Variibacter gotjawalensis]|uniref:Uncharacterized protein n=1 Tax=Variibacter gotjawalensis TaxID=1333996 RepID=A0A0S3PSJ2_9BRAD|nr:hypothetical protein [Variibacter gotjawalensis]NIK49189.1 topoisomerase IA-like protein [Variibacter gotjawalensis]RZS51043.1 hypothetical protein EV661_3516 [Variibacter gotjawalensis]BAT58877.1 hypothetical protein GJW-30_1_01405 [Variibacter gotjawalensis]